MRTFLALAVASFAPWTTVMARRVTPRADQYDLVIVGGTGAGVAAAIQASRLNLTVALLEESAHIGGIAVEGAGGADLDSQASPKEDILFMYRAQQLIHPSSPIFKTRSQSVQSFSSSTDAWLPSITV